MSTVRETTQSIERQTLSEFATLSENTKGRKENEEMCSLRTEIQRDRDRVIHSKAFRRLKHKTQVYISPESDHYRTRLTHTLEVAQISRTVARALRLNEDLTEAIALAHDLGHTPFGHAGERALASLSDSGFTHYEQGVRVCEKLEKNGRGLNLTFEVLDGILHHTCGEWSSTAEGKVVRICDHIAYMNHDIADSVRAGVIKEINIPSDITECLGDSKSKRINTMVNSLVENSCGYDIKMDKNTQVYYDKLHSYLFESVYRNPVAKGEETKVQGIVEGIFEHFVKHPEKLTGEYKMVLENEGINRAVTDYVAGMTDHFAVMTFENIYIPKFWNV